LALVAPAFLPVLACTGKKAGATKPDSFNRVVTEIEAQVAPIPFTPEEQAEFDAWDRLSDEAWPMIVEWEKGSRG
jgi:hypothetical protein